MPLLLCLLLVLPPAAVKGDATAAYSAAVLFYYGPEEYYWGNATANGSADAIEVSGTAANAINRGFVYDEATGVLEIGGLRPGANDTWKWSLLSWDANGERWTPWTGNPHDLKPQAGGAIAWSPNDTANPTPNPLSKYPWPMFRCSASRRGETLSPAPVSNLTWWTVRLDGPASATPCAADGKLFAVADGSGGGGASVVCLRESDGLGLWTRKLEDPGYSSPAFSDGKLFLIGAGGSLLALDARNGNTSWSFDTGARWTGRLSSPAVWRGMVLFAGADGFMYCLGPDGKLGWKTDLGALVELCSPAALGDKVIIGTVSGDVICLAASNGSIVWEANLGGKVLATPALSPGGYAFVETLRYNGDRPVSMNIYSIFMRDGTIQWNASYPPSVSSPAIAVGGLYLGTDTELAGHHPDRGEQMWSIPSAPIHSSPAVARGYVYFSTDATPGTICCARVGGFLEWTLPVNDPFTSSPVVADGRLFSVSANGTLWCLGRSPEPRLGATVSAPTKATEGAKVKVRVELNNTGEAPAIFTAALTVDGNLTGLRNGPLDIQPGQGQTVIFEWTAEKGDHVLGVSFNGTNGTAGVAAVKVGAAAQVCATAAAVLIAGFAVVAPLVVASGRKRR